MPEGKHGYVTFLPSIGSLSCKNYVTHWMNDSDIYQVDLLESWKNTLLPMLFSFESAVSHDPRADDDHARLLR